MADNKDNNIFNQLTNQVPAFAFNTINGIAREGQKAVKNVAKEGERAANAALNTSPAQAAMTTGTTVVATANATIHTGLKTAVVKAGEVGTTIEQNADKQHSTTGTYVGSMEEAIKKSSGDNCTVCVEDVVVTAKLSEAIYDMDKAPEGIQPYLDNPERYIITKANTNDDKVDGVVIFDKTTQHAHVVFKGTKTPGDFMHDADARMVPLGDGPEKVHAGFKDYTDKLWPTLAPALKDAKSVTFSGHSLGGAATQIATVKFKKDNPDIPAKLVTFGAPRAGNAAFGTALSEATGGNSVRVVSHKDLVPDTGLTSMGFVHHVPPIIFGNGKIKVGSQPDMPDQADRMSALLITNGLTKFGPHMPDNYRKSVEMQATLDKSKNVPLLDRDLKAGLPAAVDIPNQPQSQLR